MPDVAWPISTHDLSGGLSLPIGARPMLFFEDSSNGRCAQVKSRAAKSVRDSHLPHGRTKGFKAPHDIADKVGEFVDRLRKLQEGIRSFFIESPHP